MPSRLEAVEPGGYRGRLEILPARRLRLVLMVVCHLGSVAEVVEGGSWVVEVLEKLDRGGPGSSEHRTTWSQGGGSAFAVLCELTDDYTT